MVCLMTFILYICISEEEPYLFQYKLNACLQVHSMLVENSMKRAFECTDFVILEYIVHR